MWCSFLCRFGGLAYGEVNQMAQLNGTEFKKFTDGLLEAVQASSASRGNSLWPEIINNVDELLARLVTKENGKVINTCVCFIRMCFQCPLILIVFVLVLFCLYGFVSDKPVATIVSLLTRHQLFFSFKIS